MSSCGMNGRELRPSDRRTPDRHALRVHFGGYTSDVIVHHGVLEDGVEFCKKPFTIQTLTEKIRLCWHARLPPAGLRTQFS